MASTTVNLNQLMDQQVRIFGTWNGTTVTVTSAQIVPESFSIGGNSSIGNTVHFRSHGTTGDLAINLAALGTSLVVPFADLTVLLNPASAVVLGFGLLDNNGEFANDFDIPNVTSLVGVRVFGQGAIGLANGSFYSTNLDAKQLQ
ncbi:MAG: hypothetical protein ABIP94_03780 [Planctomycetota bacterium]